MCASGLVAQEDGVRGQRSRAGPRHRGGLVHELAGHRRCQRTVAWAKAALADRGQYHLCAGAVGEAGRGELHHQQASIGIYGDVPLTAHHLFCAVEAADSAECGRLDRLAVKDAAERADIEPGFSGSIITAKLWIGYNKNKPGANLVIAPSAIAASFRLVEILISCCL